jgi:hypothetical protein
MDSARVGWQQLALQSTPSRQTLMGFTGLEAMFGGRDNVKLMNRAVGIEPAPRASLSFTGFCH